ncbi:hypothetical protein ASC58_07920 [Phycicoccus sp. Root101]|nr:hypothetical protein ASC58_07920 [Phycicoccus sp. Root101]
MGVPDTVVAQGATAEEWLSAPIRATLQGVASRVVRHEAPPQEHAQTQPPWLERWTRGWWRAEDRWAVRVFTCRM